MSGSGVRPGGEQPEANIGSRPPGGSKLGWVRWLEIAATVLAMIAAGFALEPQIEGAFSDEEDARLEIGEVTVSNPPASYSSLNAGGLEQDPETEPTIAATVRNRGGDTAWIEEARITVVEAARFPTCVSQGGGDVPQSKRYRILLPEFPGEGRELVRRDLHVEVQPGHGARPVLSFQKASPATTNLYAVRVQLVADPGDRVIDAGRFVIGVPEPVSRAGVALPESDAVLRNPAFPTGDAVATSCFRHNLAGMRRVIAEPGRRSDYVAALARVQVAPAWSRFLDRRPPRVVVEELLRNDDREAPMYALEAAEQTGAPRYEEQVRKRVVQMLLSRAAEEVDNYPVWSVEDAERVLSLGDSPRASRLLSRGKAARRAEEERFQEETDELGVE